MCEMHGTEIIVVKNIDVKKSIEQELMEDIMSLTASFSGKLYGMRNKKNKNKEKKGKTEELEELIGKEKLAQFF